MREGTEQFGNRQLAWRASRGNVALWSPDDILLLGSGRVLCAGDIAHSPVGTLMLFPAGQPPSVLLVAMDGMPAGDGAAQLDAAARLARKARPVDEETWQALASHDSHPGLRAEMGRAKTFAQAMIAIKHTAPPGEQAGDNALRAALGASGGHPQLRLVGEQRQDEELRSAIRQRMAAMLEAAEPERFKGFSAARDAVLPPGQIMVASYWGDDFEWLADEKVRQFAQQHPILSTSLFGCYLLGDARARVLVDQIRASVSTKKAAAAWLQTPPGSGSPPGAKSPPNWWNGTPPAPVENPRASQTHVLPALQRIQQLIRGDPQRTGVALQRLIGCDCLASRTMPHLAMVVDRPAHLETLQRLLFSGMVSGQQFKQLNQDIKGLTEEHHEQIRAGDFIGRWEWFENRMIRDLSEIMAWRVRVAEQDDRSGSLCRGLALDLPDNSELVHLADRISRKLEERLASVPLTQKLKMMREHMKFEAAAGPNGGMALKEQAVAWAVASGYAGALLDGESVPDRWAPLLSLKGRERLAETLAGRGEAAELITAEELAEEGRRMSHCVGMYADRCRTGDSSIWHLKAPDSEKGSTLQVRVTADASGARFSISQHRGAGNCDPTPGEARLAKTLLASLRQVVANETELRDDVAVRRAERNIRMTEALPAGYNEVIRMISESRWVRDDPECAGFLCSEPAVRLGIPLPLENLTCDLQRRKRIGLYVEKAMSRSNTLQAVRNAASSTNLDELFRRYVTHHGDRRIFLELCFEQYRTWLPKAMTAPDLLAATWANTGVPKTHQKKNSKILNGEAVARGRAWREEKQNRMAELVEAQAAAQAAADDAPPARRRRRPAAVGDQLGAEAFGLERPIGHGEHGPAAPEAPPRQPEQADLPVAAAFARAQAEPEPAAAP